MTNKLTYHLLPTEDASPLGLYSDILYQLEKVENKNDDVKHQHLHLVSDAPIKEGDWYYYTGLDSFISNTDSVKKGLNTFENLNKEGHQWYKKIEFTTDPKLIAEGVLPIDGNTKVRIDLTKEAFKKYPYLSGIDKYNDTYDANEYNRNEWIKKNEIVNFLTEFCKRYNQKVEWESKRVASGNSLREILEPELEKNNQKEVDMEKLLDDLLIARGEHPSRVRHPIYGEERQLAKDFHNQALQSTGPFSLDGFEKFMNDNYSMFYCSDQGRFAIRILNQFIQSLTPQPKGEMVIEVEMEPDYINKDPERGVVPKIKLTNGQPTLIFK